MFVQSLGVTLTICVVGSGPGFNGGPEMKLKCQNLTGIL